MATTIRNEKLFCTCCGGEFALNLPLAIDEMTSKTDAFQELHKDCKQTWTEPKADQSKSSNAKAMWWVANGQVGMSSKTMFNCLIGNSDFHNHHPYDPDDFSRCYTLLEAVPEWKRRLHELKKLSGEWCNLVNNWDELTRMYEQNVKENWKNSKKIGMYEFMQTLI